MDAVHQMLSFALGYAWTILWGAFGIALTVLAVWEFLEWAFGRKVPIPKKWRIVALLMVLFVEQGVEYKRLLDVPKVVFRLPVPPPPSIADTNSTEHKTPNAVSRSPLQSPGQSNNAPNGIAIGGGTVSNPTVNNNYGPPPLKLTYTSQVVTSNQPQYVETEIRIVPNQPVGAPFRIYIDTDLPVATMGWRIENAGTMMGGGPYRYGLHSFESVGTGIGPSNALVLSVYATASVKLTADPHIER